MNIRTLLLSTLTLSLAGCPSTWNCNPDSESFRLEDEDIQADEIQRILQGWNHESSDDIDCYQVCGEVYRRVRGWEASVDHNDCSFSLDERIEPLADEEAIEDDKAVVGTVSCSGEGYEYFCEGRRPLGHIEESGAAHDLGSYLARCAHLEAASVDAFRQLAHQLTQWGAPPSLIERCLHAADEEAAHATAVLRLARRHGGQPLAPAREDVAADRLKVALHNAVEGCVFETWAALAAMLKAERADDAGIRAAYEEIATEEAAHGQLAWDLHTWLMTQLSPAERAQVEAAQRAALERLPFVAVAQVEAMPAALGMPPVGQVHRMATHLSAALAA